MKLIKPRGFTALHKHLIPKHQYVGRWFRYRYGFELYFGQCLGVTANDAIIRTPGCGERLVAMNHIMDEVSPCWFKAFMASELATAIRWMAGAACVAILVVIAAKLLCGYFGGHSS